MSEQTLESVYDQADLFKFCCNLVAHGRLSDWWDEYPVESLPNGGRPPVDAEEAEAFMRHARAEAIKAGLWVYL